MRIFLFLIITNFLITGCDLNNFDTTSKFSSDEQLANEITKKVATNLKEKYDLQPCGSGGQMMHEIKMLALSFDYYKPLDVEKGRELLVAAVNEFKDAINADERIHPYLFNYPFEAKNIEIRIFIYNPNGSRCGNGKLCVIKAIDGNLIYNIDDSDAKFFITIHKETYEEAMQKLDKASNQATYFEQESQQLGL